MNGILGRLTSAFRGRPRPAAPNPPAPAAPAFEPVNDLERKLMAAATDPAQRTAFQQALLKADLYAATPEPPASAGSRTLEADEQVQLMNVAAPDGTPVAAVFTSQARVAQAFGPGTGYIGVNGEVLLGLVAGQGAWLNPGSSYGVRWTAEELAAVLGNPVRRTVTKDTQVMLGVPAEIPHALIASLRDALGADPRVCDAWLALAHWPEAGTWSWYLDVRTDLSPDDVNGLLAGVFSGADLGGRPLDMLVNPPGKAEGAGLRVVPAA